MVVLAVWLLVITVDPTWTKPVFAQPFANDNDGLLDVGEAPGFPANPAAAQGEVFLAARGIQDLDGTNLLTSASWIDLWDNNITDVEHGDFAGLDGLEVLGLGFNQIDSISPGAFAGLSQLTELELDGNLIGSIEPDLFQGLANLRTLTLGGNQIASIEPGTFAGLDGLTLLWLRGNQIDSISPGAFAGLSQLTELELGGNLISSIEPDLFQGLANLRRLSLGGNSVGGNNIGSIEPGDFEGLANLETLDLGGNRIASIEPGDIDELTNLVSLDLGNNALSSLSPSNLAVPAALQRLYLYGNSIDTVTREDLGNLPNLQHLELGGNGITHLDPDTFAELPNLRLLGLGENGMTHLAPDAFEGLANLQTLDLHDSGLVSLDADFFQDLPLTQLLLRGNPLAHIEDEAFVGAENLKHLSLFDTGLSVLNFSGARFENLVSCTRAGLCIDREEITSLILDNAALNVQSFSVIVDETDFIADASLVGLTFTDQPPDSLEELLSIPTLDSVRVDRSLFNQYSAELTAFADAAGNSVTIVPEPSAAILLVLASVVWFAWRRPTPHNKSAGRVQVASWWPLLLWLMLAAPLVAQFNGVQVNVDAFGNDILGDAANEPSIAVDPNDPSRIAIGWRQFDTVASNFRQAGVAYSTNGGLTWSASVLDPGNFRSDPVLDFDADGNFYYSSLSFPNDIDFVDVFTSADGGATWSDPVPAFGGDKQWMAIDRTDGIGRGNIYQHWNVEFANVEGTSFTRSVDGAASFESALEGPTSYSKWGTLDVGPDGTLYLAGATLGQRGHLFSKSTNAQDPAQIPSFTPSMPVSLGGTAGFGGGINPAGGAGQVNIATDHSQSSTHGNVYMLGSVNPTGEDPLDVMFIRSSDQGETWSEPIRVNNDSLDSNAYQWFGTMSVAPNGRIDAIWNDTRNDPTNSTSELHYAYSHDAGDTWLGNTPISDPFDQSLGYPSQNKLGDYYDMISDDAGAYIAYAATFSGGQDVYFLRLDAEPALVPEPSSLALVPAAMLAAFCLLGRRTQRRSSCCPTQTSKLLLAIGLLIAPMSLGITSETHAQTFFLDDFDDGRVDDDMPTSWIALFGSDIDASSGDLEIEPASRNGPAFVGPGTDIYEDVSLRTQLRVTGEPFIDAGLYARGDAEDGTVYIASISSSDWPLASNSLVISAYSPDFEILEQAPTTLDPTLTDVTLQFDVVGDMLTLTAWSEETEKQAISYEDDRLQNGVIGLEFDDGVQQFFFLDEPASADFRYFEVFDPHASIEGDFNGDMILTIEDVDLLLDEIGQPDPPPGFDLTGDDLVNLDDRSAWVELRGTFVGDADLDGQVNAADLNALALNWRADDAISWGQGDFNGDGLVDAMDLNDLALNWQSGSVQASAVPEPSSIWLLTITGLATFVGCRRARLYALL